MKGRIGKCRGGKDSEEEETKHQTSIELERQKQKENGVMYNEKIDFQTLLTFVC